MHRFVLLGASALAATCFAAVDATAKITRIEITRGEPAFGGQAYGAVGGYERLIGKAHGEVDPASPLNAGIQDIALAARNGRGMVEYSTDIEILKPADMAKSNRMLVFEVLNRGNKLAVRNFNAGTSLVNAELNAMKSPGDGHLMAEGYTMIWFGWQADVLPGADRLTFTVPVAKNPDGSPVTGVLRAELTTPAPTTTLNLSSGWFTAMTHAPYPTVSTDNRTALQDGFLPTLTVRAREREARVPIANTEWRFGACPEGQPATVNDKQICYPAKFQPGRLYELVYRAKDPTVMGLGFAATRDLGTFFRTSQRDDAGTANPVWRADSRAVLMGTSQSGRMVRQFIHLGFNAAEGGGKAFEGAYPHIGGGMMPLNLRFAQPGRAWGDQIDHLYPAYDFPFAYAKQTDPLTGRSQGVLDRCIANNTCPRIFHVATALEIWEGRQSLGLTDPLGQRDVADPENVRSYIMASTQHGAAAIPLAKQAPFGNCAQQPNPNPQTWTMRALLAAFTGWVRDDRPPPNSAVPRIADGTLVAPDQVRFPTIPANAYGDVKRPPVKFLAVHNPLHVLDFGPGYKPADTGGVITVDPPRVGTASYGVLVSQVDQDGNDLGGIKSLHQLVPIGTYTGWNLGRADRFEDGFCSLNGSFIPFAQTRAERESTGDHRLSLAERYATKEIYVAAVKNAAANLVHQRFLLKRDADALIAEAEQAGIRAAP